VSWWRDVAKHAGRLDLADVVDHASEVADRLDARFGPGLELALYPAFR
jgi:hypothetical protein